MINQDMLQNATKNAAVRLSGAKPQMAFILGSGWNGTIERLETHLSIPYADMTLDNFPFIEGHHGVLRWVKFNRIDLLFFTGRHHWYEGLGWLPIAWPIMVAKTLGVHSLVLTNSAGGINSHFRPGDIMLIQDHINAMGVNPLIGPHHTVWGDRFPDMSHVYHPELQQKIAAAGTRIGLELKRGIYAAVTGPNYETPAEIKALGLLGADAVGMSTVPEAIMAHAAGLNVAGLSFISNTAAEFSGKRSTHEDVLSQGQAHARRLQDLIMAILEICLSKDI